MSSNYDQFLPPAHSNVVLDDCKFHECVNLSEFEQDKILHITPPDGEVDHVINSQLTWSYKVYCSLWL